MTISRMYSTLGNKQFSVICQFCRRALNAARANKLTAPVARYSTQTKVPDEDEGTQSEESYTVSKEDFKWVRQLLPPSRIPDPPKHQVYPTPSGWSPPAETPPDLPYFVHRTRYHDFPVISTLVKKYEYTQVANIDGDIWALNEDLAQHLKPLLRYDLATTVNEVGQKILIKGNFENEIVEFLQKQGF